jgi:hypothetical protein
MPGVEQMRRREFDGAVAWPLSAHAKQPTERMRGRVLVAGLIILLCLAGLGFIDPGPVAQEVVGQYRWRVTMDPTVLTVEQEKAKAAKPGSDFKECASGCPVMIVWRLTRPLLADSVPWPDGCPGHVLPTGGRPACAWEKQASNYIHLSGANDDGAADDSEWSEPQPSGRP